MQPEYPVCAECSGFSGELASEEDPAVAPAIAPAIASAIASHGPGLLVGPLYCVWWFQIVISVILWPK